MSLQLLLSLLMLFNPLLPRYMRALTLIYSLLLLWFWYHEFLNSWWDVISGEIIPYLEATLHTLRLALLWLWPVTLSYLFYMASDRDAKITWYLLFALTLLGHLSWFF